MHCSVDVRWGALEESGFNTALISSDLVPVDLSTDVSDESPRRGPTTSQEAHEELGRSIKQIFGLNAWVAVHMGRGAETVLASMVQPGDRVLANEIYVTGAWSIERFGGHIVTLESDGDPVFRGNLDTKYLDVLLQEGGTAYVQMTLPRTLLSRRGGAPVALYNLRALRRVLDLRRGLLVLDASRVFENAAWIRRYETGQGARDIRDIVHDLVSCADLLFLSGRKDVGASHGGVIAARDASLLDALRGAVQLLEGDSWWGGTSPEVGWELALGMRDAASGRIPIIRVAALETLSRYLVERGLPVVSCGGGAIYLDAARALPRVAREEYPAQTLLSLLYLAAGIRGIGTPAKYSSEDQIVRLSLRSTATAYLEKALPLILEDARNLTAGVIITQDRGPFLTKHAPVDPNAWRTGRLSANPPLLRPSGVGLGNAAWPQLERSLRQRLRVPGSWRLLPAASERGPQSMLVEAATREWPALTLQTNDALVERLFAFWQQPLPTGVTGEPHLLSVVPVSGLVGLKQKPDAIHVVAVDLGRIETWPEQPAALPNCDVVWACDPAGLQAPGGFLAFREDSRLYRSVRDAMLFFVGSRHDGGLSAENMDRLAAALSS